MVIVNPIQILPLHTRLVCLILIKAHYKKQQIFNLNDLNALEDSGDTSLSNWSSLVGPGSKFNSDLAGALSDTFRISRESNSLVEDTHFDNIAPMNPGNSDQDIQRGYFSGASESEKTECSANGVPE